MKENMSMKRISIIIAAAMLVAAGSCTKSDDTAPFDGEMIFSADYPSPTRATESAFEKGDAMGVYVTKYDGSAAQPLQVSGNYATNARAEFDGTAWRCTPALYWEDGRFDVYAYYPYDKPASVDNYIFTVSTDQSASGSADALSGYEASDFLWAKAEGVSRMDVVPLTFRHRMSRFVIRLQKGEDYEGDIPTDAVVRIHNTVPVADIDLASGVVTKSAREAAQSII